MTDREFDDKIRWMLAEPQEQLPDGLWAGIESRLDVAGARRRRVVVLRRAAAGLASMAAAVALVFVGGHFMEKDGLPSSESYAGQLAENAAGSSEVEPLRGNECAGVEFVEFDVVKPSGHDGNGGSLLAMEAVSERKSAEEEAARVMENGDDPAENEVSGADGADDVAESVETSGPVVDVDAAVAPECELKVDNSDIEAVYGKEDDDEGGCKRTPFEVTVGGNSFGGPHKSSESVRMFSSGRKSPAGKTFVEGSNSDSYSLPLSFGVGMKYSVTKWLGIGIGLNYTLLNKKVSGTYYDEDVVPHSTDMKNSQHYIGIPVDIYFSIFRTRSWDTYATIGGSIEKCVINRYAGKLAGSPIFSSERVKGIQTSVRIGLGVEFSPVEFLGIYIDPSVRYYFDNNQPRSIRTAQPLAFGVDAGLRFKL